MSISKSSSWDDVEESSSVAFSSFSPKLLISQDQSGTWELFSSSFSATSWSESTSHGQLGIPGLCFSTWPLLDSNTFMSSPSVGFISLFWWFSPSWIWLKNRFLFSCSACSIVGFSIGWINFCFMFSLADDDIGVTSSIVWSTGNALSFMSDTSGLDILSWSDFIRTLLSDIWPCTLSFIGKISSFLMSISELLITDGDLTSQAFLSPMPSSEIFISSFSFIFISSFSVISMSSFPFISISSFPFISISVFCEIFSKPGNELFPSQGQSGTDSLSLSSSSRIILFLSFLLAGRSSHQSLFLAPSPFFIWWCLRSVKLLSGMYLNDLDCRLDLRFRLGWR